MQALVLDEFKNLVDLYGAEWDDNHTAPPDWNEPHPYGCAVRLNDLGGPCLSNTDMEENPRVRFMPIVRPDAVTGNGSGTNVPVAGLACVFVDKVATEMSKDHGQDPPPGQWNVYVRLTDTCVGISGGDGPILKALQLVE